MNNAAPKPIAVFFTHAVSLELWESRGMFSREVKFYETLAHEVGEIWFFTYGKNDAKFADRLSKNIRIFPKKIPVPNILYGILLPFVYWNELKKVRLIRIHQMAGAFPALFSHWILRKPLLVRCGYQWSRFLKKTQANKIKQLIVYAIEYITYHAANKIILSTEGDAAYVSTQYKIDLKKISVVSNYVDTELFKPLSVEKKPASVCSVGRFSKEKNFENLIFALKNTNISLNLYGDGSLREHLETSASEHHVSLFAPGNIPNEELPKALNACEIFILPSLFEGNPKVLLEAMACGLPVIGTGVEGIESIIEHNQNGILCETDAESIHNAIADLLNNKEKQKRLGTAARETILATASLSKAIQTEVELINNIEL